MAIDDKYHYAKIAYDGYRKASRGVSLVSGAQLPEFEALAEPIKNAWDAAAAAVIEEHNSTFDPIED